MVNSYSLLSKKTVDSYLSSQPKMTSSQQRYKHRAQGCPAMLVSEKATPFSDTASNKLDLNI